MSPGRGFPGSSNEDLRALSTSFSFRRQRLECEIGELNVEKRAKSGISKMGRPKQPGDDDFLVGWS